MGAVPGHPGGSRIYAGLRRGVDAGNRGDGPRLVGVRYIDGRPACRGWATRAVNFVLRVGLRTRRRLVACTGLSGHCRFDGCFGVGTHPPSSPVVC